MAAQSRVTGFRHEAVFWRSGHGFTRAVLPFIEEGIAQGEPVIVCASRPHIADVTRALGADADALHFADVESLGANPARLLPVWLDFVDDAAGRPVRGVGEPVWTRRRNAEVAECHLHEALINLAIPDHAPQRLLCAYDMDTLHAEVLAGAERTHPVVSTIPASGARQHPYAGPDYAHAMLGEALPEPAGVDREVTFTAGDLRAVRADVSNAAALSGVQTDRSADLALAVHELAANSIRHGGGSGTLRIWREPGALVCEVSDNGRVLDPLIGRRRLQSEGPTGRGLWMVNHLCDLVQLRTGELGTTVRLHTWF